MQYMKTHKGRIIYTLLGMGASVSFLTLGFGRTLVVLLCCGLGHLVGCLADGSLPIPESLRFWRKKW